MQPQPNRKLARELQELLDLPDLQSATTILRAVCQTIKDALKRGESVTIRGFGTFKVVERVPKRTSQFFLGNDETGRPHSRAHRIRNHARRHYAIFQPSLPLMAMLNPHSPNYKERRTLSRWQAQEPSA